MPSTNLHFLYKSPNKGQHQKSLLTWKNMPGICSRMVMYISLKRLALVEEIYNASSEGQVIVATVFVKLGHE